MRLPPHTDLPHLRITLVAPSSTPSRESPSSQTSHQQLLSCSLQISHREDKRLLVSLIVICLYCNTNMQLYFNSTESESSSMGLLQLPPVLTPSSHARETSLEDLFNREGRVMKSQEGRTDQQWMLHIQTIDKHRTRRTTYYRIDLRGGYTCTTSSPPW